MERGILTVLFPFALEMEWFNRRIKEKGCLVVDRFSDGLSGGRNCGVIIQKIREGVAKKGK